MSGGIGSMNTNEDNPNFSTVKIDLNTENSPRNMKRFIVIQVSVEDYRPMLIL